jgi:putative FmdB family regulatory protein
LEQEDMPLFTFLCEKCETKSELLVSESAKVACPACGGTLVKQASHFAPMGGSSRKEMPPVCERGGYCGEACPYQ